MKRLISNILVFAISLALFIFIYVDRINIPVSLICVVGVIFFFYGLCMAWSWKSTEKIQAYEKRLIHFGLTEKDESRILLFSLIILTPMFFCDLLVSLIPLYTSALWFISVFPCIFFTFIIALGVLDEYYILTHKKAPFLVWFFVLTVAICLIGIIISSLMLSKLVI